MDEIAYGRYVSRVRRAPLAVIDGGKPRLVTSAPPILVKDGNGQPVPDAQFLVNYLHTEEKGSDVNVATHLLRDVYLGNVDAAIVVSNDSDLELPIREARQRVPVGLINPQESQTAGALRGLPSEGAGRHWWYQLTRDDFTGHQLPERVGRQTKPSEW